MKPLSILLTAIITITFSGLYLSGCGGGTDQGTKTHFETYADGSKYSGEYKDGLFDGQGTLIYPDGRKYDGQFHYGQMDGTGKMTYPDGRVEEGIWKDGKFMGVSAKP